MPGLKFPCCNNSRRSFVITKLRGCFELLIRTVSRKLTYDRKVLRMLQCNFYFKSPKLKRLTPKTLTYALLLVPSLWLAGVQAQDAEHLIIHDTQTIAPGSTKAVVDSLIEALATRGDSYKPRTEHMLKNGQPAFLNRLILEDSPYLIQHAHNPVNWYPWGEEAFALAKEQDKPIFLSIGYATCHWCHVMERESFEDVDIAKILNEHFISIKVDREQRPDVDASYMSAVTLMTGRGGWPMSSFLNTETKPFYGGTYYPPDVFTDLLNQITGVWREQRASIEEQATEISTAVAANNQLAGEAMEVGSNVIDRAVEDILRSFDELQGGFGAAPKFPQESKLFLLLDHARRNKDETAIEAAHVSLVRMAAGGIHDQVAGGFHRYSVDNDWLVPHFEKMLYNQALLSRNYLSAYLVTGDKEHKRTAERVLDYVLREMTSPEGGFYSATDADSEGAEGTFFVWTPEELKTILGEKDAQLAIELWNVTETGNFEHSNILHYSDSFAELASVREFSTDALIEKMDNIGERVLNARQARVKPLRDEKLISAWNGMMITAFAEAGDALNRPDYIAAAVRAGNFIWDNNRAEEGHLLRAYYNGRASVDSSQEDYAYLAESYLMLYDLTAEEAWLTRAEALANTMHIKFWDAEAGGYFIGTETVGAIRPKDLYDSSIPTGNAVAMRVLSRLYHRTGDEEYKQRADALLVAFSSYLNTYPSAFAYMLTAANELLRGESGHRQFLARGNVKVEATRVLDKVQIQLDMLPGWHVNANKPNQDYLIATKLLDANGKELAQVQYPEVVSKVLGFSSGSELALYENQVQIIAPIPATQTDEALRSFTLQLQACDETTCLAPEDVPISFSMVN